MIDPQLAQAGPLTFRYLEPSSGPARKVVLLLHGWTGDENLMWIFVKQPLPGTLIVAPRGSVNADPFGYGWIKSSQKFGTPVDEYLPAAAALLSHLDAWLSARNLRDLPLEVIGFSQGAALASVLAFQYPERIVKTAILAGFLPAGLANRLKPSVLTGRSFFVAHGRKDDIVPFAKAQAAVAALTSAGADVTFCPSDTTHKLSLECARGLWEFLAP